jgi:hypothetical protein
VDDGYIQEIRWLAEWLGDPDHAEPCSAFPIASDRGSFMGVYTWHGDASADALVSQALGPSRRGPLYLGRAGTTLNKRILRDDLHNTKTSTFRRSLAAVLWDELELRCAGPNMLDAASSVRLTQWMREHLSVAVVPVFDRFNAKQIESDVVRELDPPLNTVKVMNSPGRTRLRRLRRRHLAVSDDLLDEFDELRKVRAAELTDPGVVVPISRATGKGSRRSRARTQSFWTPADAGGGA